MKIDVRTNADKLFAKPFFDIKKAKTRFKIIYGGASSSKSYSAHQYALLKLIEAKHNTLVLRKYGADIKDSCFELFKTVGTNFGIYENFTWVYSGANREIRHKFNRQKKIILRGVDDANKLKSISGIGTIIMEEADQFTEEDFNEINRRVRGVEGIEIILIFNPVIETHWIKSRFFDSDVHVEDTTILKYTYKDNINRKGQSFLTDEDIEQLEALKTIDPNQYRIYVLAGWGKPEVERPYMYNFSYDKHVGETKLIQHQPVILSFDFNIDPFVCLAFHVFRDKDGHHVHGLREFVIKVGDIKQMCDLIKVSIPKEYHPHFIITGDATGRKRDVTQRNNMDAWQQIMKELGIVKGSSRMKVPISNPIVKQNRHLCNAILAQHPDVKINPDMAVTINELLYTEVDEEGNIKKKNRKREEQRSDALDCTRYLFNSFMKDFISTPSKYIK